MGGFDTVALLDKAFGTGDIASLNAKLHESKAYNIFQTGVTATAVFTGGMTTTMKCFVAGTLVLTASGLIAIENIKPGDLVYAANEDSLEVSLKPVIQTFVRETSSLIHITIEGDEIISTFDHPYYVLGKGFVSAEKLWIGAELIDNNGKKFCIEQIYRESLDNQAKTVYNFKVDKCHTYFVGSLAILVHNANYPDHMTADGKLKPNTEYSAGEHDYTYKTDSNGRIENVYADELQLKNHKGRLSHNSNTPGKQSTDHAGHLIADQFSGSPHLDNVVSQDGYLNTHEYRSMERTWAKAINNGQKVTDISIKVNYSGNSSRPSSFDVSFKIDGIKIRKAFMN